MRSPLAMPLVGVRGALGAYAVASAGLMAAAVGITSWLSLRRYRALPKIADDEPAGGEETDDVRPRVSIIVPARNEERNLPRLLASLTDLDYPDYEIIVVDDGSTDRTGAISRQAAAQASVSLRVLSAPPPAPGWTGKNAACARGAEAAYGEWLLFTDADTAHSSDSLKARRVKGCCASCSCKNRKSIN